MHTSLSCVGRVAIVEESGWKLVFYLELYSLFLVQIINAKPSCVVPTAAFWSRLRHSMVARCFTIFLRLVRLLQSWRESVLRSRTHFSTGHRTTRTSVVLSHYSCLLWCLRFRQQPDFHWPLSGNRTTKMWTRPKGRQGYRLWLWLLAFFKVTHVWCPAADYIASGL